MRAKADLTIDRLKELLTYHPVSGVFTWNTKPNPSTRIGSIAGHVERNGYRRIRLDRVVFLAHRLAIFYVLGAWPKADVDHVNGRRDDNRFSNLREAEKFENQQNRPIDPKNTSGFPGVSESKRDGKFRADIQLQGKHIFLGSFGLAVEAAEAYRSAKSKYHTFCQTVRGE
jgi:hypothetical protein